MIRSRRILYPSSQSTTSVWSTFFEMISSDSSSHFIECALQWFIFNTRFRIILICLSIVQNARSLHLITFVRWKDDVEGWYSDKHIEMTFLLLLPFSSTCLIYLVFLFTLHETFPIDLHRVFRWQQKRTDIDHSINRMRLRMCRNVRVRVLRLNAEAKNKILMNVIDEFIPIHSVQISLEPVQSVAAELSPSFILDSDLRSTLGDRWHRSFRIEVLRNLSRDSSDSAQSCTRSDLMSVVLIHWQISCNRIWMPWCILQPNRRLVGLKWRSDLAPDDRDKTLLRLANPSMFLLVDED